MSGSWAPPGGEPAERVPPGAGWYPGPEGWDLQQWWDGTVWASEPSAPTRAQPDLPGRLSAWLASPAASPLLAVVTAVTTIGWAGAAVVMAAAAMTAHPVLPTVAVDVSGFVLALADIATGIGTRVRRAPRAEQARPARAMRRAARRARAANSGPPTAGRAARRIARRHHRAFASFPRPVAWFFATATWSTVGAFGWVTFEVASHGWVWADLGTTAPGQQLAALIWMTHLIAWSGVTCRRLDQTRAAARMMRAVSADSC